MKRTVPSLKRVFLLGLVAVLPAYVTIYVLVALFHLVDGSFAPAIEQIAGFHIPGLGLLVTIVLILGAGFAMNFVLVRRVGRSVEALIGTIPFVRTVYAAVKQVVQPLVGDSDHSAFQQVVALQWPGDGLWVVGFLVKDTGRGIEPSPDDEVLVFLPTNHLHLGFVLAMKRSRLRPLDVTIEEALRMQFSLGVAAPDVRFVQDAPELALEPVPPPRSE
ncbi:MAG: DUF502 domain-containing protein [Deltaproteobacteria bacterium]|nr:DUF502 domain-containing protein [Deltaproteobacteria bacterium]